MSLSHQCRGVLVGPKGLRDGPVANRNTRFRVWPYIDELVATVPRLHTRLEGLWSGIWAQGGKTTSAFVHKKPFVRTGVAPELAVKLCGQFEFKGHFLL